MMTDAATQGAAPATDKARQVAEALKAMILTGGLPPGSDHLETEIAAMLGVSRTPVREAAVMLQGRGLLEIRPRRGLRIVPLTVSDMVEIYQILTELEPLAARLVAEARPPGAVEALEACVDAMDAALEREDRAAWAEADDAFHRLLVERSGNRRLASIVGATTDQVHRARLVTLHMRPAPKGSNDDHRRLLVAIRDGCGDEARAIHRDHRERAQRMIVGLLEKHGLTRF
jgi:DNA-binding GntR family transcriptional regulator